MRWIVGLAVVVLVALAAPASASSQRVRLADDEVVAALVPYRWAPGAVRWALATVPVYADPLLVWETGNAEGFYARTASRGPFVATAWRASGVLIEHGLHHAWDEEHHQTEPQRLADMRRLAAEPGIVGETARGVLSDPTVDNWHYTHALIERLNWDTREVPDWFRISYFNYLEEPVAVRIVLPLALRR